MSAILLINNFNADPLHYSVGTESTHVGQLERSPEMCSTAN